ncbi:MAG: hypothetical protein ACE5HS_21555 [bacterium]
MKRNKSFLLGHRIRHSVLLGIVIVIIAFGLVVASTVTKPLDISLRAHIKICKKTEKGKWEVIDEVGPENLNFSATLLELARDSKLSSSYVWNTKTKKGRTYRVRLLEQAKVDFNPVNGRLGSDLRFEVTIGDKKAIVPAKLTTDSMPGPLGNLRGKRAKGILGRDTSTMTLVSANKFQPTGEKDPLILVCTEEYTFSPKKKINKP